MPTNLDATTNRLYVNNSTYDSGGNQTAIGGYSYSYDAENRMVGAYFYAGATVQSGTAYVYDSMGQRVQKLNCGYGSTPWCQRHKGMDSAVLVIPSVGLMMRCERQLTGWIAFLWPDKTGIAMFLA